MIIKIKTIGIADEVTKQITYLNEKEKAFVTTKDGRYQRVVALSDKMASEIAKGNRYFNAIEKDGVLHITGRVSANF